MTLNKLISDLTQAAKDTGWGEMNVNIHLDHKDEYFLIHPCPDNIVVIREDNIRYASGTVNGQTVVWKLQKGE